MRPGLTISCVGHAAVLLWGLVAFAARPNEAKPVEALPVEFVSAADFSQLTAGAKNAPKVLPDPKALADKTGVPKPVKELAPKVADKPEIKTEAADAPAPKPEPKTEPKRAEKIAQPKDAKPKPDQIAEELKREEAKKPPKADKRPPEFKPDQIAADLRKNANSKSPPRFDAHQVAALLDKREPRRQLAVADTLNGAASLGAPTGHAAQLSLSELDALRARLVQCWSPPPGIDPDSKRFVVIHAQFKPDGFLAKEPVLVEDGAAALGPTLAESAKRALMLCQPFTMLKPEHYDLWKDIDIKFNNELLGG